MANTTIHIDNKEHAVIIGAQWGDEGKGKVSDYFSSAYNVSCRFSGGDNAAHTAVHNNIKHVFRILPVSALNANTVLLTSHVVFDPLLLVEEIKHYSELVKEFKLIIDHRSHLVLPYHRKIDRGWEHWRGELPLKSIRRGIGPCCADRTDRIGLRAGDLLDLSLLRENLEKFVPMKTKMLSHILGCQESLFTSKAIYNELVNCAKILGQYIGDTTHFFNTYNDRLLFIFEGAQGTLLDNSHGLYPFVAAYSTVSTAIFPSLGVPAFPLRCIGVVAAYTTQIGNAPFPTEQNNDSGRILQKRGKEISRDGYLRRCGWLDLNIVKYSATINGFTELALTKIDVLDKLDEIPICIGYKLDGKSIKQFPNTVTVLQKCEPIYETLPGWKTSTRSIYRYDDLPSQAKQFIEFIEKAIDIPVILVSTGPDREDTILRL